MRLAAAVLLLPLTCAAQHPHEQEVQRALIELDRRSEAFARGQAPVPVPPEAGQPLSADPEVARQLRPYERMRMAEQQGHILQLPPPVRREERSFDGPLALPRRPDSVVDPVDLPRPRD